MKKYVIDASVILKSLLREDAEVEAKFDGLLRKASLGKLSIISSKLLTVEVGNGLRFGVENRNEAQATFKDFLSLPIKTFVLTKAQMKLSVSVAYDLGTTVYDTSYHILAKAQNATFLTCDEDCFKKAKSLGDIELLN